MILWSDNQQNKTNLRPSPLPSLLGERESKYREVFDEFWLVTGEKWPWGGVDVSGRRSGRPLMPDRGAGTAQKDWTLEVVAIFLAKYGLIYPEWPCDKGGGHRHTHTSISRVLHQPLDSFAWFSQYQITHPCFLVTFYGPIKRQEKEKGNGSGRTCHRQFKWTRRNPFRQKDLLSLSFECPSVLPS